MGIPNVVHYFWFGDQSKLAEDELFARCFDSWKEHLEGYEFKLWNESNCDLDVCDEVRINYDLGRFALVSDYFRFKVLNEQGGLYLDTDLELLKPIPTHLTESSGFVGCDFKDRVNISILGFEPNHPIVGEYLSYYDTKNSFRKGNKNIVMSRVGVNVFNSVVKANGFKRASNDAPNNGVYYLSPDICYPIGYVDEKYKGITEFSPNSMAVHYWSASWLGGAPSEQLESHLRLVDSYKLGGVNNEK